MSDGAQLLAFTTQPLDATRVAASLLAWLIQRGIVEAMPTPLTWSLPLTWSSMDPAEVSQQ